jgi:hypothetical protein
MAILGTEGFGALPDYCAMLMGIFFLAAIVICIIRWAGEAACWAHCSMSLRICAVPGPAVDMIACRQGRVACTQQAMSKAEI